MCKGIGIIVSVKHWYRSFPTH